MTDTAPWEAIRARLEEVVQTWPHFTTRGAENFHDDLAAALAQITSLDAEQQRSMLAIAEERARADVAEARALRAEEGLNTPELHDFAAGVVKEAAHQRERYGSEHDAGKQPEDWLWLLGWLAGKAVRAARDGDTDKALHHTISSAAVLANWHAALSGVNTAMRPGIIPDARALAGEGEKA